MFGTKQVGAFLEGLSFDSVSPLSSDSHTPCSSAQGDRNPSQGSLDSALHMPVCGWKSFWPPSGFDSQ